MAPAQPEPHAVASDVLAAFASGQLAPEAARAVAAHVSRCGACRQWLGAHPSPAAPAAAGEGPLVAAGDRVGRYVVIERLGAGAMGVVYAAHDPQLDRRVALKLLRADAVPAADRAALRERLRHEARAMAQLDDPHVVTVHDVGSFGEQLFVAMELVEGQTLARWLTAAPRSPREIVAAFVAAGRGLAAAHAAGLVHRDFKPENVLVGDDGRVRVTDFGLARSTSDPGEAGAEAKVASPARPRPVDAGIAGTTTTSGFAGTPYYMAPEQYLGAPSDARSDQFSFCVALYSALLGAHPLAAAVAGSSSSGGGSGARGGDALPGWLRRALARGLAVEPAERHASMPALLAALTDTPARRRRRVAAGLAAVAALALVAGSVGLYRHRRSALLCTGAERKLAGVWDAERAGAVERAFRRSGVPFAPAAFAVVARVLDGYSRDWVAMHSDACQATRVRRDQSEELLGLRMMCLDGRLRDLRALSDRLVRADADLVERAPRAVHALDDLAGCADGPTLRSRVRPPADAPTRARVAQLRGELAEVKALERAGRYREGRERARALARDAAALRYRPLEAEVLLELGLIEGVSGDGKAEEPALQSALWAAEAGRADELTAQALLQLMHNYENVQDRSSDALALVPRVRAVVERLGGSDGLTGRLHELVGQIDRQLSRYDEAAVEVRTALALYERHYGPDSLRVAGALEQLGEIVFRRDERAAGPYYERALAIHRKFYGEDHPEYAHELGQYASVVFSYDRKRARALFEQALAITERGRGPESRFVASQLNSLALVCMADGDLAQARIYLERAIAIDVAGVGRQSQSYGVHLMNLGGTLSSMGREREALPLLHEALALFDRPKDPDLHYVAVTRGKLARALHGLGRDSEARVEALRALELSKQVNGPDYNYDYIELTVLGNVELGLHAPERARVALERAALLAPKAEADPAEIAEIDFALAQALVAPATRARARALAEAAHAIMVREQPKMRAEHKALDRFLFAQGWPAAD